MRRALVVRGDAAVALPRTTPEAPARPTPPPAPPPSPPLASPAARAQQLAYTNAGATVTSAFVHALVTSDVHAGVAADTHDAARLLLSIGSSRVQTAAGAAAASLDRERGARNGAAHAHAHGQMMQAPAVRTTVLRVPTLMSVHQQQQQQQQQRDAVPAGVRRGTVGLPSVPAGTAAVLGMSSASVAGAGGGAASPATAGASSVHPAAALLRSMYREQHTQRQRHVSRFLFAPAEAITRDADGYGAPPRAQPILVTARSAAATGAAGGADDDDGSDVDEVLDEAEERRRGIERARIEADRLVAEAQARARAARRSTERRRAPVGGGDDDGDEGSESDVDIDDGADGDAGALACERTNMPVHNVEDAAEGAKLPYQVHNAANQATRGPPPVTLQRLAERTRSSRARSRVSMAPGIDTAAAVAVAASAGVTPASGIVRRLSSSFAHRVPLRFGARRASAPGGGGGGGGAVTARAGVRASAMTPYGMRVDGAPESLTSATPRSGAPYSARSLPATPWRSSLQSALGVAPPHEALDATATQLAQMRAIGDDGAAAPSPPQLSARRPPPLQLAEDGRAATPAATPVTPAATAVDASDADSDDGSTRFAGALSAPPAQHGQWATPLSRTPRSARAGAIAGAVAALPSASPHYHDYAARRGAAAARAHDVARIRASGRALVVPVSPQFGEHDADRVVPLIDDDTPLGNLPRSASPQQKRAAALEAARMQRLLDQRASVEQALLARNHVGSAARLTARGRYAIARLGAQPPARPGSPMRPAGASTDGAGPLAVSVPVVAPTLSLPDGSARASPLGRPLQSAR